MLRTCDTTDVGTKYLNDISLRFTISYPLASLSLDALSDMFLRKYL